MTKKQKRMLATSIITPILGISTIVCASVAISNTISQNKLFKSDNVESDTKNSNTTYAFDDFIFDNKNELLQYVNEMLDLNTQSASVPVKYIVRNDLKTNELGTIEDVYDFVDKKIEVEEQNLSRNIKTSLNGEISASDEKQFLSNLNDPKVDVYRGKNNSIWTSENQAKETYFNVFEPYFFKDIYFRSKEELKLWLEKNTDKWWFNRVPNSIVLNAPNGQVSMPLQISNIKIDEKSTKEYIKNFVKVNSLSNIELKQTTGNKEEIKYYDEDHLDEFKNDYNINYININSNGGKGNYIVDTHLSDDGELNGPYFITSSSSLKNVSNTKLWRETKNTDRLEVSQYDDITILSKFFDSFLGMSNGTEDSFNIFFSVDDKELENKINDYYMKLNEKYPAIYRSLRDAFKTIIAGKRYSSFYKIPIIFYHTMDQIVYWKAPQTLVDETRNMFIDICDYYDRVIYDSIPEALLYGSDPKNTLFSFKSFFGINKMNVDLNTNLESFVTNALENYKELFKFSKAATTMVVIKNQLGSTYTMPFKLDFFNNIYKLGIDKKDEYWYRLIWYAISTDNYNDLKFTRWMFKNSIDLSDDFNIEDADNSISPYYYANFVGQWQKTLIINEAIRYSLTHSKWIYSDEQLEFFNSLGFMRYESSYDADEVDKHGENLEYMRKLYEVNNRKIENIFYIILAMFDKDSNKTLYELFGEPKEYDDEEYSSRIYDKFYYQILSDTEKFSNYSNSIFTLDMTSLMEAANLFDLSFDFDDKSVIKDPTRREDSQEIRTVSSFPKSLEFTEDGDEIIDNPEIKTTTENPTGRPILSFKVQEKLYSNSRTLGYYSLSISEPSSVSESFSLSFDSLTSSSSDSILIDGFLNEKQIENSLRKNVPNFANIGSIDNNINSNPEHKANYRKQFSQKAASKLEVIHEKKNLSSSDLQNMKSRFTSNANSRTNIRRRQKLFEAKNLDNFKNMSPVQKQTFVDSMKNQGFDLSKFNKEIEKERVKAGNYRKKSIQNWHNDYKDLIDSIDKERDDLFLSVEKDINKKHYSNLMNTYNKYDYYDKEVNKLSQRADEFKNLRDNAVNINDYNNYDQLYKEAIVERDKNQILKNNAKNDWDTARGLRDADVKLEYDKLEKVNGLDNNSRDKKIGELNDRYSKADKAERKKYKQKLSKNNNKAPNVKNNKVKCKQILGNVAAAVGTSLAIVGAAFMIFSIIQNFYSIEYISYVYETSDFRLIWDGGYRESYFFGLIPGGSKGIDSMRILEPVKIINPNIETGYYYNGYIYNTVSQLERVQYQDMINGFYKPSSVNNSYSFEKIINHKPKNPNLVNNDLNKLSENVYNLLKTSVDSNSSYPSFVQEYDYSIDIDGIYNITANKYSGDLEAAIKDLLSKIKPVKMAYIPKIDEKTGYPISRDDIEDDKSIPKFELPYKTWDSVQGGIKENNNVPEFVIVNQNEGKYKGLTDVEAKNALFQLFIDNKFNVPMKTTTKREASNTKFSKFSDLSSQPKPVLVYKANGAYGDSKKFLDATDAFNYIWESYGISVEITIKTFNIFIFREKIFYSKQEFINWVFNNTEEIHE